MYYLFIDCFEGQFRAVVTVANKSSAHHRLSMRAFKQLQEKYAVVMIHCSPEMIFFNVYQKF
jgi:hypothetical protein